MAGSAGSDDEMAINREVESSALVEHARWVYGILQIRCESFNQRAGVLLAAALALIALGVPLVIDKLSPATLVVASFALLPLFVTIGFSMSVLLARTAHDVGTQSLQGPMGNQQRPPGVHGQGIYEILMCTITAKSDTGDNSALQGMQDLANAKAKKLTVAIWAFVATLVPVIIAGAVAVAEGATCG